jgi:class 3 adenylate cyclase
VSLNLQKDKTFGLSMLWVLILGFLFASVIPLGLVIIRSRIRNEQLILESLQARIDRSATAAEADVKQVIEEMAIISIISEIAVRELDLMRSEEGSDILWSYLQRVPIIDAIYLSLEDGYHRVVTRVDENRRTAHRNIPEEANWHSGWITPYSNSSERTRHRDYYKQWRELVGSHQQEKTDLDLRKLPHYKSAKLHRGFAISGVKLNPDTGHPVVSIGWPIFIDNRHYGFIGANMTLDRFSEHLANLLISKGSSMYLLDPNGVIIATSKGSIQPDGILKLAMESDEFQLDSNYSLITKAEKRYSVATRKIQVDLSTEWQLVLITPEDDFVGPLNMVSAGMNRDLLLVIAVSLSLIVIFARNLGKHIEGISSDFDKVSSFNFELDTAKNPSRLKEMVTLQQGLKVLSDSLQAFSRFVPIAVVRGIVNNDIDLNQKLNEKRLTLFFCDISGFTAIAERISSEKLVLQMQDFFEIVCQAVEEEGGTVDKFIGDAVMAFWGVDGDLDHPVRAARAALKVQDRIHNQCPLWIELGGEAMQVRIGLHTADVLVGTIGSPTRLNYTAIGDGVNVAARLEALNKDLGTKICISDSLFQATGGTLQVRSLGYQTIRGRHEPLLLYELLGLISN